MLKAIIVHIFKLCAVAGIAMLVPVGFILLPWLDPDTSTFLRIFGTVLAPFGMALVCCYLERTQPPVACILRHRSSGALLYQAGCVRLGHSMRERAQTYLTQSWTVKAAATMMKAVAVDPSAENLTLLAEIYMRQGLFEDAKQLYLKR